MNRLIIIGSGFDIAQGIETNYYDFILDNLKTCLIKCSESGNFMITTSNFEEFNNKSEFGLISQQHYTK